MHLYDLRSVGVEHFLHGSPPLAGFSRLHWNLYRCSPAPPLLGSGGCGHLRHIGLVVVAMIFKIGEKQVVIAKNAVVANVAGGNRCQHIRPDGGMQTFICLDLLRLQTYDLSKPAHDSLLSAHSYHGRTT